LALFLTKIKADMDDKDKSGGEERAHKSATPRPKCQDRPARDILLEELENVNGELQSLRLEYGKSKDTLLEMRKMLYALRAENQGLSGRMARLEVRYERVKRSFRRLSGRDFWVGLWKGIMSVSSNGPIDARSGLTFPPEKEETFERCWRMLYVDVPHASELDCFFKALRACCTADDLVRAISRFVDDYPQVRKNHFLRSKEGISQLTTLVDSPDSSFKDSQNIARRIRNKIGK
jgi:hypothetical protein